MRLSPITASFKIYTLHYGCDILNQSFRFLIQRSLCSLIAYHLWSLDFLWLVLLLCLHLFCLAKRRNSHTTWKKIRKKMFERLDVLGKYSSRSLKPLLLNISSVHCLPAVFRRTDTEQPTWLFSLCAYSLSEVLEQHLDQMMLEPFCLAGERCPEKINLRRPALVG